jgi:hypothetical protein
MDGFGDADWEHQVREAGELRQARELATRTRLSTENQALLAVTRARLAVPEKPAGTNQVRSRVETETAVCVAREKAQNLAGLATQARLSAEDVAVTAMRMRMLAESMAGVLPSAEKLTEIARVAEKEAENAQLAEVVHLVHLEHLELELARAAVPVIEMVRYE